MQSRLDRGGARRRQRDIGRREHGVGLSLDDGAGRQVSSRREQIIFEIRRARDDELRVGNPRADEA